MEDENRRRPSCMNLLLLGLPLLAAPIGCGPAHAPPPVASVVLHPNPAPRPLGAADDGLTAGQRRGREIYLRGSSTSSDPIGALIGTSNDPVSATLVACGNCHGIDGRGRPEGGIEPSNLTRAALERPLAASSRRGRPAYTRTLIRRAITMGIDSSGERLGDGMPRYRISQGDLADLLAYLEVIGTELDPGITPTSLTIGTLLPPEGAARGLREAIELTLRAYAEDLNRGGGIYNRRLILEFGELAGPADAMGRGISEFLGRRRVFALLAPYIAGQDRAVIRAVNEAAVPMIGPFTLLATSDPSSGRQVFHAHSGLDGQARALALLARGQSMASAPAILLADDSTSTRVAEAFADSWARDGWPEPERVVVRDDMDEAGIARLVRRLASRQTDVVAYLGPPAQLHPLARAANGASWHPRLYVPGALAGGELLDLPPAFDGRVFVGVPYLPEDVTSTGRDEYERLRVRSNLPLDHQAAQMAVLAAAKVFEEGLRRSGRNLSRSRMIDELERLEEFPTGYSRPLTFGPSRHVGSTGAHILVADLAGRRLRTLGWTGVEAAP